MLTYGDTDFCYKALKDITDAYPAAAISKSNEELESMRDAIENPENPASPVTLELSIIFWSLGQHEVKFIATNLVSSLTELVV